jgi:hypothetical protein
METVVIESLKGVAQLFNLYAKTLGLVALGFVVQYMNHRFELKQDEIKIFNYVIYYQYFSLIYGILFALFIALLFFRLRLSMLALTGLYGKQTTDAGKLVASVRHLPWVASPFQESIVGPCLFWSVLGLGFLFLCRLVYVHLFGPRPETAAVTYVWIGGFDLMVLVAGLVLAGFMAGYIRIMRKCIDEIDR